MKQQQRDYLFECFCRDAQYIPQREKYIIRVNGKLLSSYETDDLFKQYLKAVKEAHNEHISK